MRTSPIALRHSAPRTLLLACIAALASGCGSVVVIGPVGPDGDAGTVADAPPATDVPIPRDTVLPPTDRGNVRTCQRTSDCNRGEECTGGAGCGTPWTCGPALGRPCTDDLAPFCGCDGTTFYGSSTCPERPYAFRGPCEEPPPVDAGAPDCGLPNGARCAAGTSCLLDRCTSCYCGFDGSLACRTVCGPDGGVALPCRSNADCPGVLCEIRAPGCGVAGTCATGPVGCTADVAPFCGCDGQTFYGSSTCPGRLFAHRGVCEGVDAGPAGCNIRGTFCPVNTTCQIDRCTVCRCDANGSVSCGTVPGCGVDAGTPVHCSSNADCPGTICVVGGPGCGLAGTCATTPIPCTGDVAPFCGCDGRTFYGSSSCPGRTYAYRGACPGVDAGVRYCPISSVMCPVNTDCRVGACGICRCDDAGTVTCRADPNCGPDAAVDAGTIDASVDAGARDAGVSCAPQDARGVGACALFLGYVWNGTTCTGIGGCSCAGVDCPRVYQDPTACRTDHLRCPIPI